MIQPLNATDSVRPRAEGVVYKKSLGHYAVRFDGRVVDCSISNKLRKLLEYPIAAPWSFPHRVMAVREIREVDPIAVGDRVRFVDAGAGSGVIVEVLPRRNQVARRAAGEKPLQQVLVANADQFVHVVAVTRPAPKWEMLDRALAAAEASEMPSLIIITKADLQYDDGVNEEIENYRRIGYALVLTSAIAEQGLEELKRHLVGRVSLFAGKSGVGKTTLLNTIEPGLGLRVNEVSDKTNKGKHTTTHLEMFALSFGGSIVDTPGLREFALWNVKDDELASLFPEMRPYLSKCRFGTDCSHSHEPHCAIKNAVSAGAISERRYQSYLRIKE